jgi:hypothetical protein
MTSASRRLQAEVRSPSAELTSMTQSGPRAHLGVFRKAAAISDSIGIPPHLLLPTFEFRCQTISQPSMSDQQRMELRFSYEAREFAQIRRLQKP